MVEQIALLKFLSELYKQRTGDQQQVPANVQEALEVIDDLEKRAGVQVDPAGDAGKDPSEAILIVEEPVPPASKPAKLNKVNPQVQQQEGSPKKRRRQPESLPVS